MFFLSISTLYIKGIEDFGLNFFIIRIIPLNKFSYINVISFVLLKRIRVLNYIVIKLLLSLKRINMVCWICYNLKVTNICIYNSNQDLI